MEETSSDGSDASEEIRVGCGRSCCSVTGYQILLLEVGAVGAEELGDIG